MSVAAVTNTNKLALHGQMASSGGQRPQPRKRFTNDYSISLNKEENEYLFSLLGDRCITLATAVIQLFLSEQPNHTRWRKKLTGVVCFVKDSNRRNYFIRVYDLDHAQSCVWQQELYYTFQYRCPRPYFHTFEADSCMAALNFATDKEAENFRRVVLEKVNTLNQKQQEKKKAQQRSNALNQPNNNFSVPTLGNLSLGNSLYQSSNASAKEQKKKDKKDKKDKKKYCKEDISLPTNFQHLHHVGWNSVGGVDSQIMQVLKEAGISQNQYENPKNKHFIDQFVQEYKAKEDHGQSSEQDFSMGYSSGYNGYPQQLPSQQRYNQKATGPPPLPQSQPSYTYNNPTNYSTAHQQQQLNGRNIDHSVNSLNLSNINNNVNNQSTQSYVTKPAPPIPHSNPTNSGYKPTAPRPPPLPTNLNNIINNNQTNNNSTTNKTSPDMSSDIPPPPPLPPPLPQQQSTPTPAPVVVNCPPPKPPPPQMNNNQPPDTRSALLDQIRQGRNLKKVDRTVQSNNTNSSQGSGDSRDALLDQIRRGVELKSVNTNAEKPAPSLNTSGLAGALAKALQERSRVLQPTDESSSDSSVSEDEEWSD